ncbi:MAG: aldehyde dehydrogenase (NAD+) [Lasallia pustulata]|uniref:Aldehyde dehydrogenase (NAD+) n=1 Tax=Lasallia pustulata TaxID=136370 RepID=A0A5M8Q207_9LECA|nr:MAG: aldehyde dehydrogenase (NAD+) [Lasallia pustulata]
MSLSNPAVHDEFVERLKYWNREFEGGEENEQMCQVVNERNFDRLKGLLEMSEGDRVYGGRMNRGRRYIQATVVIGVDVQDSLMSEELLGPICPVIKADYITANQTIK